MQQGLSCLTSLRALWLQHAVFEAPATLGTLPRLYALALVGAATGWAAVLEGLAAAAGRGPEAAGAAAGAWPAAAGLAAAAAGPAGDAVAVDAAGHASGCALRALHLQAHAQSVAEVPGEAWRALARLPPGLTRLELPYNRLGELPEGRYLRQLRVCAGRAWGGWQGCGDWSSIWPCRGGTPLRPLRACLLKRCLARACWRPQRWPPLAPLTAMPQAEAACTSAGGGGAAEPSLKRSSPVACLAADQAPAGAPCLRHQPAILFLPAAQTSRAAPLPPAGA